MTTTMEAPRRRGRPPKTRTTPDEAGQLTMTIERGEARTEDGPRRYLPLPVRGTVDELHHQEAALLDRILRDRTSLEWHRMALEQTVKLIKEQGGQPLSEISGDS